MIIKTSTHRSSYRRYSVRKGFLRNFTKFTGKHLCQSLFFNKAAGLKFLRTPFVQNTSGRHLRNDNFIKKETLAQVFSCEFSEISKNTFFTEQIRATASELNYRCLIWNINSKRDKTWVIYQRKNQTWRSEVTTKKNNI